MDDVVAITQLARLDIRQLTQRVVDVAVPDLDALSRFLSDRLLSNDALARVRSPIVLQRLEHTTRLPRGQLR